MKSRRIVSLFLNVLLVLSMLAPISLVGTQEAYADNYAKLQELNFDGYTKNSATVAAATGKAFTAFPQNLNTQAGEYYDGVIVAPRTDKSLVINSKMTNGANIFASGFNLTGKVIFEADVRFSDTIRDRAVFEVKNANSGAFSTFFKFQSNGVIAINGKNNLGIIYQANTWYHVQAILDNTKGTGDFYIDGALKLGDSSLPAPNNIVSQLKFWQNTNSTNAALQTFGQMALDNVVVTQINSLGVPTDTGQNVKGWQALKYAGEPVFAEDTSETVNSVTSMTITAANGAIGSYVQDFPVIPGEKYSFSSFWRGKGLNSATSYIKGVLTAMKNGQKLKVDNFDVEEETPATKTDNNIYGPAFNERILYHYSAPADADSVRVQLVFAGPGTVWFNDPRFERKLEWQDVMGHYSSADVAHPITNPANMFGGSAWSGIAGESDDTLMQKVAPIMAMSDTELQAAAKADAHTRTGLDVRGAYESMARRLAVLYSKTADEVYAHKAIVILTEEAKWYPDVPLRGGQNFFFKQTCVPVDAVYSYDLLFSSPEWGVIQQSLYADTNVRALVEGWFRTAVINMFNYYSPGQGAYDNIAGYGVRAVFGTAAILNDPDMIRLFLPWVDSLLSPQELYAEGFWNEATVSYHDQVIGLLTGAFQMLQQNFVDPSGYVDNTYHLQFNAAYNLGSRYPLYDKALRIDQQMKLPDGSPVAINDTWNQDPKLKSVNDPILPQYLHNSELYDYGHFSLVQGDKNDATFAGLAFPQNASGGPYRTGGHQHAVYLNMNLFGSGMEVVPYTGYPHAETGNYRYPQMTGPMHNIPWVWSKTANYGTSIDSSTRSSMLAYDPGDASGKTVQLVEASELGPVTDNVDTKRRMLMMVNMDGNRSYTLDLSRLKGGDAHQIFMRAVEDEDTDMTTSLNLTAQPDADVKSYMTRIGHTEGLADARDLMKTPYTANGDGDFNFTWTGKTSGTSLRAYMNGVSGDEVIFSRIPTWRWTYGKAELKDAFPGWHFQRRQLVNPSDTTSFGAVYETWRKDQQPMIAGVTWEQPADHDPMTQVAVVDVGSYVDTIYISNDTTVREVDGVRFAGRVAMIRTDKATGTIMKGYIYGEGSIVAPGFSLQGKPDLQLKVVGTTSTYNGPLANGTMVTGAPANTLTVDGSLPSDESLNGLWLQTKLGDQSGFGLKINSVQGNTINVHDYPPFTITAVGAKESFFPFVDKVIPGDVLAEIHQPSFLNVVKATGVSLSSNNVIFNSLTDNEYQLDAIVAPANTTNQHVEWSSSNPDVVTVDQTGRLTAVSDGEAVITVTTEDGGFQASASVQVDRTAPEIQIALTTPAYLTDELSLQVSIDDALSLIQTSTVQLDGREVSANAVIDPLELSIGTHTIQASAVDHAGNAVNEQTDFEVKMDIGHLGALLQVAAQKGWIQKQGILNSLLAKADNLVIHQSDSLKAVNDLNALGLEIQAQASKSIESKFADRMLQEILPYLRSSYQ